jgi:hypothetical protein
MLKQSRADLEKLFSEENKTMENNGQNSEWG